jgi:hypothetical protein
MREPRVPEGWAFFAWVSAFTFLAIWMLSMTVDLRTGPGVVAMIRNSVRLSTPWLFLAFSASSMVALFPSPATRWLMRNRRMLGLCFAAAMGWQLFFIFWMLIGHWGFYVEVVHPLGGLVTRLFAYAVLISLTVTSFAVPRRWMGPRAWHRLHKTGIYILWLAVWGTYAGDLFVMENPPWVNYVFAVAGLFAWLVRVAAYFKKRQTLGSIEAFGHQKERLN